jgi:hypothetical protein
MLGPSMAKALYNAMKMIFLDSAIDIKRFIPKVRDNMLFLEIRIIGRQTY